MAYHPADDIVFDLKAATEVGSAEITMSGDILTANLAGNLAGNLLSLKLCAQAFEEAARDAQATAQRSDLHQEQVAKYTDGLFAQTSHNINNGKTAGIDKACAIAEFVALSWDDIFDELQQQITDDLQRLHGEMLNIETLITAQQGVVEAIDQASTAIETAMLAQAAATQDLAHINKIVGSNTDLLQRLSSSIEKGSPLASIRLGADRTYNFNPETGLYEREYKHNGQMKISTSTPEEMLGEIASYFIADADVILEKTMAVDLADANLITAIETKAINATAFTMAAEHQRIIADRLETLKESTHSISAQLAELGALTQNALGELSVEETAKLEMLQADRLKIAQEITELEQLKAFLNDNETDFRAGRIDLETLRQNGLTNSYLDLFAKEGRDPVAADTQSKMEMTAYGEGFLPSGLVKKMNANDTIAQYVDATFKAAEAENLNGYMLATQYWIESRYKPNATSPKGAQGIAQFMPKTGKSFGLATEEDRKNPYKSIAAGAKYTRQIMDDYGIEQGLANAAYNGGIRSVTYAASGLKIDDLSQMTTRQFLGFYEGLNARLGPVGPGKEHLWRHETYNYANTIYYSQGTPIHQQAEIETTAETQASVNAKTAEDLTMSAEDVAAASGNANNLNRTALKLAV